MSAKEMKIAPLSGIDMLIVGSGIAGLTLAIESHRKGHSVRVIERRDKFDNFGDIFGLGPSAFQSLMQWPGLYDRLASKGLHPALHFYKFDGKKIAERPPRKENKTGGFMLSRAHAHDCLYEYALELGIPVTLGQRATKYSEDAEKGYVTLEDGSTLTADIVVAADGVGGKSHMLVSSTKQAPISSGYALYRASFPLEDAMADPLVAAHWADRVEHACVVLGSDVHMVIGKNDARNTMCWLLTHKDERQTAKESWTETARASDALRYVPAEDGWADHLRALIASTTNDECIDWRLMWRDPQPTWHSPRGRVVQVGDACHPFLPSSGSGAVMAMEDGYSLAACLQVAGKGQIPLAVKVHNKLRFERVSCAQKNGFKTRHQWHKPDWKFMEEQPEIALRVYGRWLYVHDAEKYAYEMYGKCVDHIFNGAEFANTNIPKGYVYEPWTAQQLVDASARGEEIEDAGDWS